MSTTTDLDLGRIAETLKIATSEAAETDLPHGIAAVVDDTNTLLIEIRRLRAVETALTTLVERWERMGKNAPDLGTELFIDEPGPGRREQHERAATYRRTAADVREVLATGRIPHDLMTDAELGG